MSRLISKRQQAVLDSIEKCTREKGYGPTVRELCEDLGLSSPSTVHVHLNALEQKGLIKRDPLKSRSITIVKDGVENEDYSEPFTDTVCNVVSLPLVGNVAAGSPIYAEENITEYMSLPVDIVGDSASYLLKVHGDSMIEIGINDGDYVAVREQSSANNGDIVVAIIEDGATVKRFYKESNRIRLQPENSSLEPIYVTDCLISGKVVAVFRRL